MNTPHGARGAARVDRISSGRRLLDDRIDMRTKPALRFRYLVESYSAEIGGNGNLTEAERAMVRQVASLQVHIEQQQARIVAGEAVDVDQLIRLNSEHRRLLGALNKKADAIKPAGPTLADFLAQRAARVEDEDDNTGEVTE
jgi:hypothetical protein